MHRLTSDIPLGPFENTPVPVFVGGRAKNSRIHANNRCVSTATPATMRLDANTLDRMCKQCATWGRWAEPDSALGIFLQTVRSMPRGFSSADELEEDFPREVQVRAARLLAIGEYPDDEDDDGSWDEFEEARSHRDEVANAWLRSADDMIRLATTVKNYPWLAPWAEQFASTAAQHAALLRQLVIELVPSRSLVLAAAANALAEPSLPYERAELALIGPPGDVRQVLRRAWSAWQSESTRSWLVSDCGMRARAVLHDAFERKRKGREAALTAVEEIVSGWESHAAAIADACADQAAVTMTVSVEQPWARPYDNGASGLTSWETGVLAHWVTAFDWPQAIVRLEVPRLIADRIRAGRSALTELEPTTDQPSEASARVAGGLVPGVLDDAPVSARVPATVPHLDALFEAGAWLFQVWSVGGGAEVLPLDTIRSRTRAGWRGVIVAGPGDLPDSLVDPWVDEVFAAGESEDEADPLGLRAGEILVARFSRRRGDPLRPLRTLALARSVSDLRILGEGSELSVGSGDIWSGLLTAHRLDLTPFRPPSDDRWKRGLDLPLSALGDAQVYSTNLTHEGIKGHSPACSHAHSVRGGVDSGFDLATVRELVAMPRPDWCSKCGGYAVRRLDDRQLQVYRTAHVLMEIDRELEQRGSPSFGSPLSPREHDEILGRLREVKFAGDEGAYEDEYAWSRTVQALSRKASRLVNR